eukprot:gene3110-5874_t
MGINVHVKEESADKKPKHRSKLSNIKGKGERKKKNQQRTNRGVRSDVLASQQDDAVKILTQDHLNKITSIPKNCDLLKKSKKSKKKRKESKRKEEAIVNSKTAHTNTSEAASREIYDRKYAVSKTQKSKLYSAQTTSFISSSPLIKNDIDSVSDKEMKPTDKKGKQKNKVGTQTSKKQSSGKSKQQLNGGPSHTTPAAQIQEAANQTAKSSAEENSDRPASAPAVAALHDQMKKFGHVMLPLPAIRNAQLVENGMGWTDVTSASKRVTVNGVSHALTQETKGDIAVIPHIVEQFRKYGQELLRHEASLYEQRAIFLLFCCRKTSDFVLLYFLVRLFLEAGGGWVAFY